MEAVILDGYTINPGDLTWKRLALICDKMTVFDNTPPERVASRIGACDIVMTSKCHVTREIMEVCPNIKYIGSMATGYNNIDVQAATEMGIAVTNIPSYATDAVAQHTFALILELTNHVGLHNESVQLGEWEHSEHFCYWVKPISLLAGKSIGIIGYGEIGKKVAEIAEAFGMTVNIYSRNADAAMKSDFVSLHCPLTEDNIKMVNSQFLVNMKPGAYFINTARGGLVDEEALASAIKAGFIAGAAVDVLGTEPPADGSPLIGLDNCIITPHMAWAPEEMRRLIIDVTVDNLAAWLDGRYVNRVDG
ncbi:MAG: D-2-hydroxyacid dehydrogenase [Lentihominibacter sp.]|jgi:glycerate dehydrogenase